MERAGGEDEDSESEEEAEPVRRLIRWQAGTGDTGKVWLLPAATMLRAADAAERMVEAKERKKREREARRAEGWPKQRRRK